MNLIQFLFGGGEKPGKYPESLIDKAIERAVEGTDDRIRLLPGYQKHLRQSVIHAMDHVVALVDAIPAPLQVGRREYGTDPRMMALFSSADAMLDFFGRDASLGKFLTTPEAAGAERITTLLLARREERRILGMDLAGDHVRRDVPQISVNFTSRHLVDPAGSEEEAHRRLKRRAFDHILMLALTRISEVRVERKDLLRQRDLLRRKCTALECGGWSFETQEDQTADPAALSAELDDINDQLAEIGVDGGVLQAHLDIVAETLGEAERQLWTEDTTLSIDRMNIKRDPTDPSALSIDLQELHNARGQNVVALPISLSPGDVPPREDFLTAAQRYL